MQKFKYTAVDLQNQKIKGIFLANDEYDLAIQLARQHLYLVEAKPYSEPRSLFPMGAGKVSAKELTFFCRQFAIMQNTHIPILDCLSILKNQSKSAGFGRVLQFIYDDVKSGSLLSEALDKHPKTFPAFFRSMIHVGEASGKLDAVLNSLADYYETTTALKRKVANAMAYPVMLLFMIVGLLVVMLVLVIPAFRSSLSRMDIEVTGITKAVYDVSDFVLTWWGLFLISVFVLALALFLILHTEPGHYWFDVLKLKLPLIGSIHRNMITARFARAFGLLLSSGMDMNAAMIAVEVVISNRHMKKKFHAAAENVRRGTSLALAFDSHKLFPDIMLQMVAVGEQTDALPEVLMRSCSFFDAQTESAVTALTSRLLPAMLLISGCIVGLLFIAVYSPMLSIITGIG